ncbi:hypothetical protein H6G89_15005 [Oscillatoria sp. FACHB-1407]|uniref:hypothetical protein n=1 Tax=Oscillatoria sp. FACHB-1407 TaxID=2692847 RepID=UPI001682BC3F|nr:hypothetical protein [Oscillatoria sp. FACHB-1407]MBD2462354.1 hypothetical protein [Oscillatoria sp. FACHB-1407]
MGLFNRNDRKSEETRKVRIVNERSRVTEKHNGDVITDTYRQEIEFEGSSEDCKNVAAHAYLAGKQEEQRLLSDQPERSEKRIRALRAVNE